MDRVFFFLGAVLAGMGVAAGAFGAHALRGRLTPELLGVFETGVRYHLIHALGLLAVAWATTRWPGASTRWRNPFALNTLAGSVVSTARIA